MPQNHLNHEAHIKDDDFRAMTPLEKCMFGQAIKHSGKLIAIGGLFVICSIIGLIAKTAFSYASITMSLTEIMLPPHDRNDHATV